MARCCPVVPVDIRGSRRAVGYVKCLWWHVAVGSPFLFVVFLGRAREAVVIPGKAKICELERSGKERIEDQHQGEGSNKQKRNRGPGVECWYKSIISYCFCSCSLQNMLCWGKKKRIIPWHWDRSPAARCWASGPDGAGWGTNCGGSLYPEPLDGPVGRPTARAAVHAKFSDKIVSIVRNGINRDSTVRLSPGSTPPTSISALFLNSSNLVSQLAQQSAPVSAIVAQCALIECKYIPYMQLYPV